MIFDFISTIFHSKILLQSGAEVFSSDVWSKSLFPEPLDIILILFYLFLIYAVAKSIERKNIDKDNIYKYFVSGLFVKIFGGIAFCLIFQLYYHEQGDTFMYYRSSEALVNLMQKNFYRYFLVFVGDDSAETYSYFDASTGWPIYYAQDYQTFAVIRFVSLFTWLAFKNYYTTTILLDVFTFFGMWKLYTVFCKINPSLYKQFAIAVLFVPSVAFWGSGILKDSFTISFACLYTYNFYRIFIERKKLFINILGLIIAAYVITSIKPYIFLALMPGSIIWLSFNRLKNIKSKFLRVLVGPFIIGLGFFATSSLLSGLSGRMGTYSSMDKIVEKAQKTQQDLIRGEQYGSNYYNIGEFDGTMRSMVTKAPIAITAGLFRPFLWEARNPVMIISALENTVMLIFVLFVLFKVGPFRTISIISSEPVLIFSFLFAIFFAFSVGLTTANFGALVRYRIPAIPFFVAGLFIMRQRLVEILAERQAEFLKSKNK
ncbi:MAG: hypothetical protein PHD97_09730 [Bacteroidales bacterium]|nr:hypothetical protein [Bacteroidales bacterium]